MNRFMGQVSLLLVLILSVSCTHSLSVAPTANALTPTPTPTAAPVTYTIPQADNILSCNLYGKYQAPAANTFFSPFSILTCLAMAQEGAAGSTASQMQSVLNLNPNAAIRQQGFQQLINQLNSNTTSYTLNIADNIWVQQGFNILPAYTNTLQTYYDANAANVDFVGNPAGAVNTINNTVSQETGGFIPTIVSTQDVNAYTRLVLTNAIYFQSNWQSAFPVVNTSQQPFHLTPNTSETVTMMNEDLGANLGNFNGAASVIAVPYQNNKASMYVFLPTNGITALENAMTGFSLTNWLTANAANMTAASNNLVSLSLPKFSYSTSYDLTSTLPQMGMTLPFLMPGANFSGIDGQLDLYIGKVLHQAYVAVTETGTTATAATVVTIPIYIAVVVVGLTPPTPFVVNQPFIFAIVDNATNTVLFMGQVNTP